MYAMCRQKVGNRYLPPSFLHLNFDKGSVTDPVAQLLTSWLAHKLWRFPVLYLPSGRVAGVCCYTYFYIGTRFPNSGFSHVCSAHLTTKSSLKLCSFFSDPTFSISSDSIIRMGTSHSSEASFRFIYFWRGWYCSMCQGQLLSICGSEC